MPTDQTFDSDGVRIAYDDEGDGHPIVLVHGFASSRHGNWQEPSWYDALLDDDRRVIALDCRGHGESEKPHDPDAYGVDIMARDVVNLLDHLAVPEADLMGYSMGGRISTQLLAEYPGQFNAVVLAGIGGTIFEDSRNRSGIAEALEADDPDGISDPVGKDFREFAEARGNDLDALAAIQRGPRSAVDKARLGQASLPVLVVAGEDDELVGDPRTIADAIPGAEAVIVPGRDHLTTVGDKRYKDAVIEFLEREGL